MQWSIFVCLLAGLARVSEGGALRCPLSVAECSEENIKITDTKETTSPPSHSGSLTECLSGTEWDSKCHKCRCSDAGIAQCLKEDSCEQGIYEEPYLCKPNTTFVRGCNKCLCLETGMALCSMEYCTDQPQVVNIEDIDKTDATENSEQTDSAVATSNDIIIENSGTEHVVNKRSEVCKPREEFFLDCNPCKCAADGRSYSCTRNECLEGEMDKEVEVFKESEGVDHIERHSVCRARNTFYISCNTCHCNALGTDYTCTTKPCPLPADVELFHELKTALSTQNETKAVVCIANRMFVKDCNTCWCNEDGTSYFCTRRVCVPLLPDEQPDIGGIPAENLLETKKQCRPDEVFEVDCNMCRCNSDGKSYSCTRRACVEQYKKKNSTLSRKVRGLTSETTKACQPGQEFRLDCNKCLCDDEGQDFSCTRMDCNVPSGSPYASALTGVRSKRDTTQKIPTQCVAGSVFDRECNVCRCTQDGNFALCTLKSCVNQNEVDHTTESENGFRCNPGEQFKRDCNDCTCSADGRSVFCTLRLCDQDIAADI